jgi:hypothetical protein
MDTVIKRKVALFVDQATKQWVVRDPDGNYWQVAPGEDGWENRQQYELNAEQALESIPGHYRYMLRLPF